MGYFGMKARMRVERRKRDPLNPLRRNSNERIEYAMDEFQR